jgi:hypothetical protein
VQVMEVQNVVISWWKDGDFMGNQQKNRRNMVEHV